MSREPTAIVETSRPFRVGDWVVNPSLDEISRIDRVVKLEPRMVRLLACLAAKPGDVVSAQQLLDSVWPDVVVGPASVYQAVSHLRKLLGDTGATPTYIATVPKKGYRLVAPVHAFEGKPISATDPAVPAKPHRRRILHLGLALASLASLVTVSFFFAGRVRSPPATGAVATPEVEAVPPVMAARRDSPSIAVLRFRGVNPLSDEVMADAASRLLRDCLATSPDFIVIGAYSAERAQREDSRYESISARLRSRYLVDGTAAKHGDVVRLEVRLVDGFSGAVLWFDRYERAPTAFSSVSRQIAGRIASMLQLPPMPTRETHDAPLDAIELYILGQRLLAESRLADFVRARELFERSVEIDPRFARGHLGIAQALQEEARLLQKWQTGSYQAATRALDRATELDANLGEAWTVRATLSDRMDAESEEMRRRAITLAPNDPRSLQSYASMLWLKQRNQEALPLTARARAIEPLSVHPLINEAALYMSSEPDYATVEKLLREALALEPDNFVALMELGQQLASWHDEDAEGIRMVERALKVMPDFTPAMHTLATLYLMIGEIDAAAEMAERSGQDYPKLMVAIARRDGPLAAKLAKEFFGKADFIGTPPRYALDALIADALANDELPELATRLEEMVNKTSPAPLWQRSGEGLAYARVLMLMGDQEKGAAVAKRYLEAIDARNVGPPRAHWLARDRATALLILGEDEPALAELEKTSGTIHRVDWWYVRALDPVFEPVRRNPRFQSLMNSVERHRLEQAALLEDMRRRGEIPRRRAR